MPTRSSDQLVHPSNTVEQRTSPSWLQHMLHSLHARTRTLFEPTRTPQRRLGSGMEALEGRLMMEGSGIENACWPNLSDMPSAAIGYIDAHPGTFMYDVTVSPDGTTMAAAGQNGQIKLLNAQTGQVERTLTGHERLVLQVTFSPDSTKVASVSYDGTARIWNRASGQLLRTIPLPEIGSRIEWSGSNLLGIGIHMNQTRIYNMDTDALTTIPYSADHTEAVRFDFSNTDNSIVHTNGTNLVVHHAQTGAVIRTLTGINEPLYSVDIDPSGTYVAAGTSKGRLLIWNKETGQLLSNQSINRGTGIDPSNIVAVQFARGNSSHIISGDHLGNLLVQNIAGLQDGTPPTEVSRMKVAFALNKIVSTPNGHAALLGVGDGANRTRALLIDLPDPPAPPPAPQVVDVIMGEEQEEGGDEEGGDNEQAITTDVALVTYAADTVQSVGASLEVDSASVPALQRRITEETRTLADIDAAIVPAAEAVANAEAYVRRVEAELEQWNAAYATAIQTGNNAAEFDARRQIDQKVITLRHARASLEYERSILDALNARRDAVMVSMNEAEHLLQSSYDRLRTQTADYVHWAQTGGQLPAAAQAAADALISRGYQTGYNSLPHVRMDVTVLDRLMGSSDVPAHFLAEKITEIREHESPVIGKGGGLLKVVGRVTNTGDRAGPITVRFGATSDLHPNDPDQYSITTSLNPGESKDFVSTVMIPPGKDSTGSLRLRTTTPDEDDVVSEVRNRESRTSEPIYYQKGERAVWHNSKVISMTEGIGTPAERMKRYLAANPIEARSIAHKMQSTVGPLDAFSQQFLSAYGESSLLVETKRQNLIAMLGMNTDSPLVTETLSSTDPIYVIPTPIGKTGTQELTMLPNKNAITKFTLDTEAMVNFWVNTPELGYIAEGANSTGVLPNLSLTISGTTAEGKQLNNGNGYKSKKVWKAGGESISIRLPAGHYSVVTSDDTDYFNPPFPQDPYRRSRLMLPKGMKLHYQIDQFTGQHIQGRISIEESAEALPVSLWVAEYENNKRLAKDLVEPLNKDLPVWVVIHGMYSSEKASIMDELTRSLSEYENVQVLSLDWKDAAASGLIMTQDAPWAVAAGQWAARQLMNAGVDPTKINIAGWSHGSYVGFELAAEILRAKKVRINSFVALDAANNIPLISGYDHTDINFSSISAHSLAIDSSVVAGSNTLAATANASVSINSNEVLTHIKHRLAVTAFTEILTHEKRTPSAFSKYLSLEKIMKGIDTSNLLANAYNSTFEWIVDVRVEEIEKHDGTYHKAIPIMLKYKKAGSSVEETEYFDSLYS